MITDNKKPDVKRFILGLHGYMGPQPVLGVHDGGYCLADLSSMQVLVHVESEKFSGVRHDGRIYPNQVLQDLKEYVDSMEIATSQFVSFRDEPRRIFPLVRDINPLTWDSKKNCLVEEIAFLGRSFVNHIYFHELAHVFSSYMYREKDHTRFLGWVVEGSGSFAQNSLFMINGQEINLLSYNDPILSGMFFNRFLSNKIFDIPKEDFNARHATPGKVMALAAYGDPCRYREPLLHEIEKYQPGQPINYRDFCPEILGAKLSWKDRIDLCASGQALFEDLLENQAHHIHKTYPDLPVYYSGGCALSIRANSKLRNIFNELVIPPNCGDDGQALGLVALHTYLKYGIRILPNISNTLKTNSAEVNFDGLLSDSQIDTIVGWLIGGEIFAFVQGLPEVGPRALGHRSIIGNPTLPEMKERLNYIKNREYFRPVAPIVLNSVGDELFENYFPSPYMLYEFKVRSQWLQKIPSAIHIDGTARIQTVLDDCSNLARLLRAFSNATGFPPLLLNTSLNSRGKPIAATYNQILSELASLKIRYLVIGNNLMDLNNTDGSEKC